MRIHMIIGDYVDYYFHRLRLRVSKSYKAKYSTHAALLERALRRNEKYYN